MSDHSSPAIAYDPAPSPASPDTLEDKIDSLSRRFDTFCVEMREAVKDMATVVRIARGGTADNEDRITALENGFVAVKHDIATINQAAEKRRKAMKK